MARRWFWRRNNDYHISFMLNVRLDNVAVVAIDVHGKGGTPESWVCRAGTRHPEADRKIKRCGRCFLSQPKADSFIAARDINASRHCKTRRKRKTLARRGGATDGGDRGRCLFDYRRHSRRLHRGGLEMALACHRRICTDDVKTVLRTAGVQLRALRDRAERGDFHGWWGQYRAGYL
ncbi:hypothetical protein KCP69_10890 [Salmonella enterica subsp. enterica]|nr:hypothetical protein KCP69_10890 [Salmonella enterica subsp. enterica]